MRYAGIVLLTVMMGALLPGCFVDSAGVPEGYSRVWLSVPADAVGQGGSEDTGLPYALGLWISVSGEGIAQPVTITRTWVTGAVVPSRVSITKDIPAGEDRRFVAVAFMQDAQSDAGYRAWTLENPVTADLPEGEEVSVDIALTQPGFGAADVTVTGPAMPATMLLAFEHEGSSLRIPAVDCSSGQCAHEALPVGLPMIPVLIDGDGAQQTYPAKKITLDREGARVTVSIIRE